MCGFPDVETFIVVTLKSVALSPPVKTLQSSLIKSLEKLKEKYPSLREYITKSYSIVKIQVSSENVEINFNIFTPK